VRRVRQPPTGGDPADGLARLAGISQFAPAVVQAPATDPVGHRAAFGFEELLQIARRDVTGGSNRRGGQLGIIQPGVDEGLDLQDEGVSPVGVRRPYLQALFAKPGYDPLAAADSRPQPS
jgi:hypothetical protein